MRRSLRPRGHPSRCDDRQVHPNENKRCERHPGNEHHQGEHDGRQKQRAVLDAKVRAGGAGGCLPGRQVRDLEADAPRNARAREVDRPPVRGSGRKGLGGRNSRGGLEQPVSAEAFFWRGDTTAPQYRPTGYPRDADSGFARSRQAGKRSPRWANRAVFVVSSTGRVPSSRSGQGHRFRSDSTVRRSCWRRRCGLSPCLARYESACRGMQQVFRRRRPRSR
jgi:hypothetical protein